MQLCRDWSESPVAEAPEPADSATIDLKDPALAALLAWLIPGLGHWYQGRRAKAALYFVCIMGLFAYGVYLSSSDQQCLNGSGKIGYGRAVYFSWRKDDQQLALPVPDRRRAAGPARAGSGQPDEQPPEGVVGRVHGAAAAASRSRRRSQAAQ